MIFVTVGTQLPFDRLVCTVDAWAAQRGRHDIFAQIGSTPYRPSHIDWRQRLTPREFRAYAEAADAIVAHAGIGVVLTAIELARPLIVMPRRAELSEHRNDHQLATARQLSHYTGIHVVHDAAELHEWLDTADRLARPEGPRDGPRERLLRCLRAFVEE